MFTIPIRTGKSKRADGIVYFLRNDWHYYAGEPLLRRCIIPSYTCDRMNFGTWHNNYLIAKQMHIFPYSISYHEEEGYYISTFAYNWTTDVGDVFGGYFYNPNWARVVFFDDGFNSLEKSVRTWFPGPFSPEEGDGMSPFTGLAHDGINMISCGHWWDDDISPFPKREWRINKHAGFTETVTDIISSDVGLLGWPCGNIRSVNGVAWNSNTNDLLSVIWSCGYLWDWWHYPGGPAASPASPFILKHDGFSNTITRWKILPGGYPVVASPIGPDPTDLPIPWGICYDPDNDYVLLAVNIGDLSICWEPNYPITKDFLHARVYRYTEFGVDSYALVDFIDFNEVISGIEWVNGNLVRISPNGRHWTQDGFSTDILSKGNLVV